MYGSEVTYVIGTLLRRPFLRRSASSIKANSYAGPKQDAPCAAPITTGPGFSKNFRYCSYPFSAWSKVQTETVFASGPRPSTSSNASLHVAARLKAEDELVDGARGGRVEARRSIF